ncbi:hypothetical protein JW962_03610 [Candidatus Dojkabacteria bacterium]|nr:hypothetical protein [Candidatus Dojkabacteria bacterium]
MAQSVNPNKQPIFDSTQDHLDIVEVIDDMLLLRGNKVAVVIQTTAVNFDLLSDEEQDSRIMAFASLLNSVTYPLQIVVRTKKVDISNYLTYLRNYLTQPMSEGRRTQMQIYLNFIQNLIVKNEILDKQFYVVVSYSTVQLGNVNPLKLLKRDKQPAPTIANDLLIEQAKANLYPKRDHIIRQLINMGVKGYQLTGDQLKDVFYNIYN